MLGPINRDDNPKSQSPVYITDFLENLLHSYPAIGLPMAKQAPITANAKPTIVFDTPKSISLIANVGSIKIKQIIAIEQPIIARAASLTLKI